MTGGRRDASGWHYFQIRVARHIYMHLDYNPNNYCYKSGALTLRFAQYANKKKNGTIKFDPGGQPDERAIKIKRNRIHIHGNRILQT